MVAGIANDAKANPGAAALGGVRIWLQAGLASIARTSGAG
jgi:hypothetical protein